MSLQKKIEDEFDSLVLKDWMHQAIFCFEYELSTGKIRDIKFTDYLNTYLQRRYDEKTKHGRQQRFEI